MNILKEDVEFNLKFTRKSTNVFIPSLQCDDVFSIHFSNKEFIQSNMFLMKKQAEIIQTN